MPPLPRLFSFLLLSLGFLFPPCIRAASTPDPGSLSVTELRCEYLLNPQGIDMPEPRLFWKLHSSEVGQHQTAYRVLASSSEELLKAGRGDLWDSGKVSSEESAFVRYAGRPLTSRQVVWWKVQVWDSQGRASAPSGPARWTTGMMASTDWAGKWIASDLELMPYQKKLRAMTDFGMEPESEIWQVAEECRKMTENVTTAPAVYLRKEFEVSKRVRRATACVSGLGMFELYVNGQRIGDARLDPAYTDYQKRVYYLTHNAAAPLREGKNAVGVVLGNGWFNLITPHALRYYAADYIAPPQLILDLVLEYEDGTSTTVVSDSTWKTTTEGPLQFNCVLAGESYDARQAMPGWSAPGFNDAAWKPAREVSAPEGRLQAQILPPVRSVSTSPATTVTREGEIWRFDIGFETVGHARLRVRNQPPGQEITVHYPGSGSHTLGRYQTCKFVCRGGGEETFESSFSYNGYRFVEVRGLATEPRPFDVEAVVVCTDMEPVGEFSCSDTRLNKLQEILLRTVRNFVVHTPSDPTREKAGWTQDVESCFWETAYNFAAAPTFIKWQRDFLDAVHENGYMPPVAPSRFDGPTINGPWWGGAVVYTPWYLYQFYGDRDILVESYPSMQKYFGYLESIAKDGIIEWGLGDWMEVGSVRPKRTPVPQTSTCAYYYFATILEQCARLLKKPEDAARYGAAAARIREAYNRAFLNAATGQYAQGSQTSQLISLVFGLAPEERRGQVLGKLVDRIAADKNHLSTGFIGTPLLLPGLSELGRPDLAWSIATQTDYPSFIDAILNRGQTVFKEDWNGGLVQMPSLQGPIGTWFYHSLAGIRVDPAAPGFRRVILRPELAGDLTWAKGTHETLYGPVRSEWERKEGVFRWTVSLPPNVRATAYLPSASATRSRVGDAPLENAAGVRLVGTEKNSLKLELESGKYVFTAPVAP